MTSQHSDADRVAVEAYRNRKDWKIIHEEWEEKTRRSLSPQAFGKHITGLHEEIYGASQPQLPPHASAAVNQTPTPISATHRSPINAFKSMNPEPRSAPHLQVPTQSPQQQSAPRPPPPPAPTSSARVGSSTPQDHLHNQPVTRAEFQDMQSNVMRLHDSVMRIQEQVQRMAGDLTTLYDRRSASQAQFGGSGDEGNTLDRIVDTLAQMSSKVGDIDGMKVQLDVLKNKLKRLEGEQPQLNITAPSPREQYNPAGPSRMPPPPAPPGSLQTPISATTATPSTANTESSVGWNAVNSHKRKLSPVEPGRNSDKRPRGDSPAGVERSYPYAPSSVPTLASMPRPPERPVQASPTGYYPGSATSVESPQQWISESGRQYGVSGRRGPGRPRKSSPELPTPTHWEKEPWVPAGPGQEYRPISAAGVGTVDLYPDRGRIIRRGSGGIGQPFYSHNSAENLKKTRQRPVRNQDGVLIRKDGKPDQRSVSSPMNLKKVHARKMEAAAAAAATTDGELQDPDGDNDNGNEGDYLGEGSQMSASNPPSPEEGESERPTPVPAPRDGSYPVDPRDSYDREVSRDETKSDSHDKHKHVMQRMFPNGIEHGERKHERMFTGSNEPEIKPPPREDSHDSAGDKKEQASAPTKSPVESKPALPASRNNSEGRISPPKIDTACVSTTQAQAIPAVTSSGEGDAAAYKTSMEPSTAAA